MLTRTYHYNQVIKKSIAVFGTLFNNITIARMAETNRLSNVERVPIAYGPRQKYLDRLLEQPDLTASNVAIKVPRMSYQITSLTYDAEVKLNRLNQHSATIAGTTRNYSTQWQSTPYLLGIQLNIFARDQDDALQCLEQILPIFQPEYTVTVKDMEAPGVHANVPITLNSVGLLDEYEGAMENRRAVIYTLDFTMRIRFTTPPITRGIIRFTETSLTPSMDTNTSSQIPIEYIHVGVSSTSDTALSYTITTTIDSTGF